MNALRSAVSLSAALLGGVLLSACSAAGTASTSNLTGDSKAIAQTISNLQSDAQSHSSSHVCDNDLASAVVSRLNVGSQKCSDVISKQLNEADDFTLTLASANAIAVTGDTATARVKDTAAGHKNHVDVVHLVREGKIWKIASIG